MFPRNIHHLDLQLSSTDPIVSFVDMKGTARSEAESFGIGRVSVGTFVFAHDCTHSHACSPLCLMSRRQTSFPMAIPDTTSTKSLVALHFGVGGVSL